MVPCLISVRRRQLARNFYLAAKAEIPQLASVKHVFSQRRLPGETTGQKTVISLRVNASAACEAFVSVSANARRNLCRAFVRSGSTSRPRDICCELRCIANNSANALPRGVDSLNSPKARRLVSERSPLILKFVLVRQVGKAMQRAGRELVAQAGAAAGAPGSGPFMLSGQVLARSRAAPNGGG
ncbi:hypothetical protein OKW42_001146 [Paraburkholderia sp. WC7.3d]